MTTDDGPKTAGLFSVRKGDSGGQSYSDRDLAIHAMRSDGATLQVIGDAFGITRERVRQLILMTNGLTADEVRAYRERIAAERDVANAARLIEWLKAHPGSTREQARAALGWNEVTLAHAWSSEARRLTIQPRDGSSQQQYVKNDYLVALRAAWALVSGQVAGLSEKKYSQLVRSGQVAGPSSVRVIQVFKTWSAALSAADVPALPPPSRTYRSTWTDEEMLEAVAIYLGDAGTSGTYAGWAVWRRTAKPDAPSAQTLRNRLGPWSTVKARALQRLQMNRP